MNEDSRQAQILATVSRVEEGQKRQDERLDRMDRRLAEVEKITLLGRGAAWMLLRTGALIAAAIAGWEWLKQFFQP